MDAEKMYPSIQFELIRCAGNLFLQDIPEEMKDLANKCLDMIRFGMDNCFVTYEDQYRIYCGMLPVDEKGLTIGGFESASFADLVAAYILVNAKQVFNNSIFNKIYRYDGIDIKKTILSVDEVCDSLDCFQSGVNELTGSEYLQFTADVWDPDAPLDLVPRNKKGLHQQKRLLSIS